MCTGVEIAGLLGSVVSGVGSMIQMSEEQKNAARMAEARNERMRSTLAKNDELAQRSRETFNERNQKVQAEQTDQAQKDAQENRQEVLETAVEETPAPAQNVALSGSAPTVVKSELAKRMGEAIGGAKEQAKKLGTLGGYGDMWLGQGFQDVQAGRSIANDANFASGNMAILPYQQDIAEMRAYKPISPIGGLLQGFGSMLGSYGGGGGVPKKQYTSPTYGNSPRIF